MSEKRPRIRTETLDKLGQIVGTSDSIDIKCPENTSVERQVEALTEAYLRSVRDRRDLALRVRVLEQQAQQRQDKTESGSVFPSTSSRSPGRSSGGGRHG